MIGAVFLVSFGWKSYSLKSVFKYICICSSMLTSTIVLRIEDHMCIVYFTCSLLEKSLWGLCDFTTKPCWGHKHNSTWMSFRLAATSKSLWIELTANRWYHGGNWLLPDMQAMLPWPLVDFRRADSCTRFFQLHKNVQCVCRPFEQKMKVTLEYWNRWFWLDSRPWKIRVLSGSIPAVMGEKISATVSSHLSLWTWC